MATAVSAPRVPANARNFIVPSNISLWCEPICADGTVEAPVEIGHVGNISFTANETFLDMKSARFGVNSTVRRAITDISGTLSFQVYEVVGTNLNLIFRPVTTTLRQVAGGNALVIPAGESFNLSGTAATEFAQRAQEFDPTTGTVFFPNITILSVESSNITDHLTGRGTIYDPSDYVFTQPGGATSVVLPFDTGTGTLAIGDVVTGQAALEYAQGAITNGVPGGASASGGVLDTLALPYRMTYTAGTGTATPSVGEVVTFGVSGGNLVGGTIVAVESGATAVAGVVWVTPDDIAGGHADVADFDTITGLTGTSGFDAGVLTSANTEFLFATVGTVVDGDNTAGTTTVTAVMRRVSAAAAALATDIAIPAGIPVYMRDGTASPVPWDLSAAAGDRFSWVTGDDISLLAPTMTITSATYTSATEGSVNGTISARQFLAGTTITGAPSGGTGVLTANEASLGATSAATLARTSGSNIPSGSEVRVTYTYERDAVCMSILDGVTVNCRLSLYVFTADGPQFAYIFNNVQLSTEGAIEINPEARLGPTLTASILPDGQGNRGSYCSFLGFGTVATCATSSVA